MSLMPREITDLLIHSGLPDVPAPPDDLYNRRWLEAARPEDWKNPKPAASYNLVIIGAGTAGLVAASRAARLGAKVALIERAFMGGTCLNLGCVPSKTLARSALVCSDIRKASSFGVKGNLQLEKFEIDFPGVLQHVRSIRAEIAGNVSAMKFSDLGVDVFIGEASFADPTTIQVAPLTESKDRGANSFLKFKKALIATGARPKFPNMPGLNESGFLTNETVFNLKTLPKRLAVIGGGPLGCEFAQAFQRFGSNVTIIQNTPLFLPLEERDAAQMLSESFARDHMQIRLNTEVVKVSKESGQKIVHLKNQNQIEEIQVDEILTGIGRAPNVEGLALEAGGIRFDPHEGIEVNDYLATSNPRVFAAGDVCSDYQYTHAADAAARIVVQNALFFKKKKFSDLIIPWCTYTDPEIAHIGIYVRQARARNVPIKSYTIPMHQVDRAVVDGETQGFAKIHVREGTDKILGATIVARHASEMINEVSLAMVAGLRLRAIEKVIHSYPTQAEAIHMAADACARARRRPIREKLIRSWLKLTR